MTKLVLPACDGGDAATEGISGFALGSAGVEQLHDRPTLRDRVNLRRAQEVLEKTRYLLGFLHEGQDLAELGEA